MTAEPVPQYDHFNMHPTAPITSIHWIRCGIIVITPNILHITDVPSPPHIWQLKRLQVFEHLQHTQHWADQKLCAVGLWSRGISRSMRQKLCAGKKCQRLMVEGVRDTISHSRRLLKK